jgi:thiosulfate dehydrogenase (quinone) large subunit
MQFSAAPDVGRTGANDSQCTSSNHIPKEVGAVTAPLASKERVFRGVLGLFLAFVAYNVGLTSGGTEPKVLAWGAAVLAVVAIVTAIAGAAGPLARIGLDANWSVGYLAARLYVGWEFLDAGWLKATSGWYTHHAGTGEVQGILSGAIAQSKASAKVPFPAVSHWFAYLADHVFLPHAHLISYLVVTGEMAVGIGLILGLFLRLSAFFGITLNSLFLFAGALGAGLNPEMVILGFVVLTGASAAVYAAAADRYGLKALRGMRPGVSHTGQHVPAH